MVCGLYPVGVHLVATLPGSWPAGRRKRSSAARSAWRARRPSASAAARRKRLQYVVRRAARRRRRRRHRRGARARRARRRRRRRRRRADARQRGRRVVELPEQKTGDLKAAAKAAGCKLDNPEIEGATHETKDFKAADYKTNPPTSGNHNPDWYEDGIYAPGDTPELGMLVHTLEHGRIDVQYKEGTSADDVAKLEALLAETRRLPHAAVPEHDRDGRRRRRHRLGPLASTCPTMNDTSWTRSGPSGPPTSTRAPRPVAWLGGGSRQPPVSPR